MPPNMFFKIGKLFLYPLLFVSHGTIRLAIVSQHLPLHIVCLINLSVIQVHGEIICRRHVRHVVVIACHHRVTGQIRTDIIIFEPEQRIWGSLSTKIISPHEHRAQSRDFRTECRSPLVEIRTLLYIITGNFSRGNIAGIHTRPPVLLLVIYMITFQQFFHVHLITRSKRLVAIQFILVCRNLSRQQQVEQIRKQVYMACRRLHRII